MKTVFNFDEYKLFILFFLGGSNKRTGSRSALAKFLGCQTAYISQVLNGVSHFSMEQGFQFCEFANLDKLETQFFLLLLQKDRAGIETLSKYLEEQIQNKRTEHKQLNKRLNTHSELSDTEKVQYYSDWTYAALHMALSIPNLRTREAICKHFGLSADKASKILDFLVTNGLAEHRNGEYYIGDVHIHLPDNSSNIWQHHAQWRMQSLRALENKKANNLHYSVVYSLSRSDASRLKEKFIQLIKENISTITKSPEEILICNNIDFFEI